MSELVSVCVREWVRLWHLVLSMYRSNAVNISLGSVNITFSSIDFSLCTLFVTVEKISEEVSM